MPRGESDADVCREARCDERLCSPGEMNGGCGLDLSFFTHGNGVRCQRQSHVLPQALRREKSCLVSRALRSPCRQFPAVILGCSTGVQQNDPGFGLVGEESDESEKESIGYSG